MGGLKGQVGDREKGTQGFWRCWLAIALIGKIPIFVFRGLASLRGIFWGWGWETILEGTLWNLLEGF